MDRAEGVKLVLLEIVDFKQLQPAKLKWKNDADTCFDVIDGIQTSECIYSIFFLPKMETIDRCELKGYIFTGHTQFIQAFQFAFGTDTDAKRAHVIVALQKNAQTVIHFSHSKSADANHKYGIKIVGTDRNFRVNSSIESI